MTNTKLLKLHFMVYLWTPNGPDMLRKFIAGFWR